MPAGNMTVSLRINADGSVAVNELNRLRGGLNSVEGSARSVTNSLKSMAMTAAAALGVGSLAASFLEVNRSAGMMRASLETVTGSVANAQVAWEALSNFAAKTPYSLDQAVQGFVKLKAMGLDPSMASMTSFGNTASAMGKSLNQMVEAVADAATGEFERLKEFGITASASGNKVALTFQGVTTTIGKNANEIVGYLQNIGNVQFAGAMEKQAQSLEGAISNVGDAWNAFMLKLGDTGMTQGLVAVIGDISTGITSLGDYITGADGQANAFSTTMASMGEAIATTYSELKTGVWSDTTTAIMATAGAVAGWIALSTALSVAIGAVTTAFGILTAVLMANPFTLAIAAIGATAGALYVLSDQTITLGDTTTTVGATVSAVWETTASYSQAVWETFSSYVSAQFNSLPPAVTAAGNAVLSVWSATMSGFMSVTGQAINYVMNLFRFVGRSAGVLAGEVAMSLESGFSFDRLKEGLADEVKYTDMLGESSKKAAEGIKTAGKAVAEKAGSIAESNTEEQLSAVITQELTRQNKANAQAMKLSRFEHDNLTKSARTSAAAVGAGGAAHKGAAKETDAHAKSLDALIAKYLPAKDHAEDMAKAVKELDIALAQGKITQAEYNEMLKAMADDLDKGAVKLQALIDKYDTEGARARALAKDRADLNDELAKNPDRVKDINIALDKLTKAEQENTAEGKVWQTMWENAVKRVDDTFAGMWKNLITGTGNTLDNLKDMLLNWLAEVSYQMLLKPIVVGITTTMLGGTGTAGAAGQAASGASSLGGFSNFTSLASNIFSLGTSFISGVSAGFQALFSGTFGTAMEFAGAGIMSGTGAGIAGGLGAMMPILAPLVIGGGLILNKYFKDKEPRYGAYGATTTGRTDQFEDGVGVKGAFGLTFGMNDMGTANVDAEEMRKTFEGFAKVSQALADFYGKDVEAAVKASLAKASMENWGKNGLMNYAMNAEQAFQIAFTDIIKHAAATGDAVAVVMSSVVGSLQGTLEDMADQIERGMLAAKAAVGMAEAFQGQEMGDRLGLAFDTVGNALKLVDYANAMKLADETTAEAMGRMALNLGVLDAAMTLTGTQTDAVGMDFVNLANALAEAANDAGIGMEGLMKLQAFYYDQFYSATEKATKAMQELLKGINKEWPKLKEKMLWTNDKSGNLVIPELKDPMKAAGGDGGSSALYAYLREQFPNILGLDTSGMKVVEEMNLTAEDLAKLREQFPKWWGLDTSGMKVVEEMNLTAEDLAKLREQFPKWWGVNLPPSRDISRWTGWGSVVGRTGATQDYEAEAKAALRAAEMYAFGLANGTISKNTETEAKIQAALMSYADELKAMGYDVTQGVLAVADQIKNWAHTSFMTDTDRQSLTKDPNADIYARLVNDMPKSRDEFEKLIGQIDVTTESGAMLYAEIMKLVPAFDAMYDSIESFEKWLGVTDETALATKRLEKVFADLGLVMPTTKAALLELYNSGVLTAEMMATLGVNLEDLSLVFKDLMHELDPTANAAAQKAKNDAKNALLAAGYQGDFTGPSIAAFLKQLLAMDDSALEAYKALLKLQDGILALAKIAEQRAQMNVRLIELTQGREAALAAQRALELAALDPSLRALQQRIWLLEDEAAALNELNGIMDRIYNAIGADDLARELKRKLELAAADARNRPFLLLLYQIEDEQRARQKQLEAEKTALAAAHTARMEALAQEREATQELLTTAQGLLSSIQSALSSLRSQLPLDEINLARSRRALADWASAKELPDQKSLDRAITGIGGDDAKNYATASAYLLAKQGDLVNLLTLEQLAQTKVSDAEKLLQSLDDLQSALTKQHEAAMAALDAKYALDEDWKKRQLDLLNELLAKMYPDQAPADRMPMKYQLPPVPKDDQERQDKQFSDVIAEIALLRRDMANLSAAQIAPLKSLDDRVKKWDLDGLPGERDAAEMSYLRAA